MPAEVVHSAPVAKAAVVPVPALVPGYEAAHCCRFPCRVIGEASGLFRELSLKR